MSLGLATKGILSDYNGIGSGTIIIPKYVGSVFEIEAGIDIIEVNAEVIRDTITIDTSNVIDVEVDIIEDDTVLRYYTDNIHPLTPNLISEIQSYYVDTDKDWLIQAMDEAVRNNKKTWAYIETIIKAWKLKGKVSKEKKKDGTYEERLAAAKKHEREYEEKLIREENYVK